MTNVCIGVVYLWLGELGEILGEGAADLRLKRVRPWREWRQRFVEGDALDAGHGEKEGEDADALGVRLIDLADEMVEGIQIDAA